MKPLNGLPNESGLGVGTSKNQRRHHVCQKETNRLTGWRPAFASRGPSVTTLTGTTPASGGVHRIHTVPEGHGGVLSLSGHRCCSEARPSHRTRRLGFIHIRHSDINPVHNICSQHTAENLPSKSLEISCLAPNKRCLPISW